MSLLLLFSPAPLSPQPPATPQIVVAKAGLVSPHPVYATDSPSQ